MKRILILACAVVFISACSAPAAWDLKSDFSLASNPNGQWQYGCSDSLGGTFSLLTVSGTRGWSTGQGLPSIWKNDTTDVRYGVPMNMMAMLPGLGSQVAIARWIAPQNGSYAIAASFLKGDYGSTQITVLSNNTSMYSAVSSDADLSFAKTVTLSAGSAIDFAIGNYDSSWEYDNTPISATITQVPEPVSALLLLCGSVMLGRRRK